MTNSWDKIRLKHAPKDYKRGPGPTGKDRLHRRLNSLHLAASRLARKSTDDAERQWAERLAEALSAFNAQEFARSEPYDITALVQALPSVLPK